MAEANYLTKIPETFLYLFGLIEAVPKNYNRIFDL